MAGSVLASRTRKRSARGGRLVFLVALCSVAVSSGSLEAGLEPFISAENGCPVIPGQPSGNGADKGWLDTGVNVPTVGAGLSLGASGTIQVSPGGPNETPAGQPGMAGAGYCLQSAPAFSLIGCIGDCPGGNGVIFPIGVGSIASIPAPAAGRLYVGVNDNFYDDNSGDWYGAFGLFPNVFNFYVIDGVSNGGGWMFELTKPGAAPQGRIGRTAAGLPVGTGPQGFAASFSTLIGSFGLPNVAANIVFPVPTPPNPPGAAVLSVSTPGPGIDLWVSAPPGPLMNAGGAANLLPGVTFNPTIQSVASVPGGWSIPTASGVGLIVLVILIAAAGIWIVVHSQG